MTSDHSTCINFVLQLTALLGAQQITRLSLQIRTSTRVTTAWGRHLPVGSIPVAWVAFYSGHVGNTFCPKGFAIGSSRQVSSSK
jgi:hypothetical protein